MDTNKTSAPDKNASPDASFGGLEPLLKAVGETPWGSWEEAYAHFRSPNVTPEDLARLARWVAIELTKGTGLRVNMPRATIQAFFYRRWLAQRQLPTALSRTLADVPRIAPLGAREARSSALGGRESPELEAFRIKLQQRMQALLAEAKAQTPQS